MSRIQSIAIKDGYRLEALLDNGSSITLNLQSRLGTVRFGLLADPAFFAKATTDGAFIRWEDRIEISLTELFQLAQKSHCCPIAWHENAMNKKVAKDYPVGSIK